MKKLILVLLLSFLFTPAFANHSKDHVGPFQTITVEVNGLVCDFCATALEKVFYKNDHVEGVSVDLDARIVKIDMDDSSALDDVAITKLITDAGYSVVKIDRTSEK